ncbi:iron-containing redox enzyme family protein [Streptomyces sp. NPDC057702]|uniref:iron-containing redox enzyme family protein n=1 Tax=unclassified Streptomyces TaxID=2593676 RepID=UPI00369E89B2
MSPTTFDIYEAELTPHREAFAADPAVRELTSATCDEHRFAWWLLRYSVHGVAMTAPVESWIAGAGSRCAELGDPTLGRALKAHSRAEAGHDRMMVADARAVAGVLGERFVRSVDVDALLAEPPLASARSYVDLHETVIAGPTPHGQLGIEYEIEQLSLTMGPLLLHNCERVFGPGPRCYTFLAEHVELDGGHTAFNRGQLRDVLAASPRLLPALVDAGSAALASYARFMGECLRLAEADLDSAAVPS